MNKNIVLGGVVVIAIVAFIALSGSNKGKQEIKTQTNSNSTTSIQNGDIVNSNAGSYESYAPEKLAFAETGNVVLFFHASWCPSCRALEKDIKENLGVIPTDLRILKVDYDNSKELKQVDTKTKKLEDLTEEEAKRLKIDKQTGKYKN